MTEKYKWKAAKETPQADWWDAFLKAIKQWQKEDKEKQNERAKEKAKRHE